MPIRYDLDIDAQRIHTRCIGQLTFDEVMDHFRELSALDELPPSVDVLLDLTEMGTLPESDQMRSVAVEVDKLRARLPFEYFAIVANRDALYGMVRMFQVFVEGHVRGVQIFRDLDTATSWLAETRAAEG